MDKNPKSMEFLKRKIHAISINSKKIKKDDIFIAIKGLNFDGHDYINEAFKKWSNSSNNF
ncbi:Mur ligase domain-containing protein [Methylophilaceae bacterium]|nr:Mur ligase domain-containing protein [Methylophilaceae bacterium]